MGYTKWFNGQADRHRELVDRLRARGLNEEQIIDYFDFEHLVTAEPDYCPLFKKPGPDGRVGRKCHDLDGLNCFLCACPFFRFDDAGIETQGDLTQKSLCSIGSKHGRQGVYGENIHQDCSRCTVPHRRSFVRRHYDVDWRSIMRKCDRGSGSAQ